MDKGESLGRPFHLEIVCADRQLLIRVYGAGPASREIIEALEAWGIQARVEFCSPCG